MMSMAARVWGMAMVLGGLAVASASANPTLGSPFTDHAVLQQETNVTVWGWAESGEVITVRFAGQEKSTKADAAGKWRVTLDPMKASWTPQELTVAGKTTLVLQDILVGEVWLCSGQSNMGWKVHESNNGPAEILAATNSRIRLFKVAYRWSDRPMDRFETTWQVCSPETAGEFPAAPYYFARKLTQELDGVPIGLLGAYAGNSRIETWMPASAFGLEPELKERQAAADNPPPGEPYGDVPAAITKCFNAEISPLIPFAIRGAIWYQGEANGTEGLTYLPKMKALVRSWRQVWGQGDFPFYYMQLANFNMSDLKNPAGGDGWSWLRETQRRATCITNTGMAVAIDLGAPYDVHPKNKQETGRRFALWALAKTYSKDVVCSGPLYRSHTVEGNKIRIAFDHVGGGLVKGPRRGNPPPKAAAKPKPDELELDGLLETASSDSVLVTPTADVSLKLFAIAGADYNWQWAQAVIDGDTVVVSSGKVPNPVAVRYAFFGNPQEVSLYNAEGLPASPFSVGPESP